MNKPLKILLLTLFSACLLVVLALVYVVVVIDPNDYKAHIQNAAAQKGVNLVIEGDLSWQVIPRLAIRLGETQISNADRTISSIRLNNSSLSLAWKPLLKQQIHIKALDIDGADIQLNDTNQTSETNPEAPAESSTNNTSIDKPFDIAIDTITITNANITLPGEGKKADTVLNKLSFTGRKINLQGEIFFAKLSFGFNDGSLPEELDFQIHLEMGLDQQQKFAQLQSVIIKFDETTITGNGNIKLSDPRVLTAKLQGDTLSIDRYKPTASKRKIERAKTPDRPVKKDSVFTPLLAPVAFLEGGKAHIDLLWDTLIMDGLQLNTIQGEVDISEANIDITRLSANLLGGSIESSAHLGNVSGQTPSLNSVTEISNISLGELSKAFANEFETRGTLKASLRASTRGTNSAAFFDNLNGSGTLLITKPELKNINIEQSYCKIAALVEKIPIKEDWLPGTKLHDTKGNFRIQGRTLLLDEVNSGTGNLSLKSSGNIDLATSTFNILAVTRLNGDRTSETGCVVESTRLHNRDIPLRCKDSFENAGAKSCLPDGDIIQQLARDKIAEKISEKLSDKLDPESDAGKAVDSLLKGIFGRNKDE